MEIIAGVGTTLVIIDEPRSIQSYFPKYECIQHLVNHATYHRGQIVTIARNIGITDAPMTDYNFLT